MTRRWCSLLAKELRALLPMAALCFVINSGDVVTRPFTEQLDTASWTSVSALDPDEGPVMAMVLGVLAFFMAYAAFPREQDEGTLDLLLALPIPRREIFLPKAICGAAVLITFVSFGQVTNWLLQLPNPQSYSGHQFRLDVALTAGFLLSSFALVVYCHGLLASTLRVFGLLPYALAVLLLALVQTIEPALSWLDPSGLCRFAYRGQVLLVPWGALSFHLATALLVALPLAYAGWMGPFEALRDRLAQRSVGPLRTLAVGCTIAGVITIGLVIVTIYAVQEVVENGPPAKPHAEPEGIDWQIAEASTEHYQFVYPTNLRARALRLIGAADALAESAAALLGAREVPSITVDLAEQSQHHEGIAAGTRLRMGLVAQEDPRRLEHVLAHETTHVLQGRESDRRLMTQRGTRALVEGSAEWVAYEVVSNEPARRQSRIVAAASWARHDLELEQLLDDDALRARWDTSLVYSLGEVWTEAIAQACGRGAVGDLMRTIGREGAARDLDPLALARDALQSIGCSEVAARGRLEALLASIAEQERAAIDRIPRAGAGVVGRTDEHTIIRAELDRPAPEGAEYSVRIRRDRAATDAQYRTFPGRLSDDARAVELAVPVELTAPRFQMQFCVVPQGGNWPFCEEWLGAD